MNSIQLEDIVKNNLANYEARYDANDWARMEGMLGAAPDSSSFNWKPVLIIFVVCIFLGGAYALYTYLDFSGTTQKPSLYTPTVAKKPTVTPPPPAKKIVPVITSPPVDTVFKGEDEPVVTPPDDETTVARSESKPEKEKIVVSEDSEKEIQRKKEESDARRARRKALAAAADSAKAADGSKEVSKKNEKSEKKEKAKSSSAIGFNIFSTINADSLKKYQERLKKDSVK